MTRQESFKRRVRERMASTGERYTAARRSLLAKAAGDPAVGGDHDGGGPRRTWASEPEMSDAALVQATGRTHDEWADLIDTRWGDDFEHAAVARWLEKEFDSVDGWWAQTITVGYERITGRRLPYQRSDGLFACNKSRTVTIDADVFHKLLLSDEDRADLFPDQPTQLRSKPTTKALRIAIGPEGAVAIFGIDDVGDGRSRITVQHERLPTHDSVEEWKFYWSDWFDAVERSANP